MTAPELTDLSATAAADAIRAGELSSVALVQACLERIAEREPVVRAWRHLDQDVARAQARARDAEPPRGALHGVPVGVKDLIDTADQPTGYGSPIYDGHRPTRDAACVARLRAAGAVILGKTVTTEFALFHPGPTTNPHDPTRTPGGSSSGSAAAVADRMVPLALGTQTAASVIRPASYCGVFGCKPTFDLIPTTGVKTISPSLDTIGMFAHDPDDLLVALKVMADRAIDGAGLPRVALVRTHEWEQADEGTRAALTEAASALGLAEVRLPDEFATLVDSQTTIMVAEIARCLAPEHRDHADDLSDRLRGLIADGARVTEEALRAAREHVLRCRALLPEVLAEHDVALTPSAVGEAPVGIDATGDPLFGRIWTALGAPSVAVPGLRGPSGLPLGVQVVAAPGQDAAALAGARWLADRL